VEDGGWGGVGDGAGQDGIVSCRGLELDGAVGAFDKRCLPRWEAILGVLAATRSGRIIFNQTNGQTQMAVQAK